jgi:pyrroloquinoline-quinone synthase
MMNVRHFRPGLRRRCVRKLCAEPWPIAIAFSIAELFAPDAMATRLDAFQNYYTSIASN